VEIYLDHVTNIFPVSFTHKEDVVLSAIPTIPIVDTTVAPLLLTHYQTAFVLMHVEEILDVMKKNKMMSVVILTDIKLNVMIDVNVKK
jgi:hypothetical protein